MKTLRASWWTACLVAVLLASGMPIAWAQGGGGGAPPASPPSASAPPAPSSAPAAAPPRGGTTTPPKDASRNIASALPCSACHTTSAWRTQARGESGFDHSTTGFPLTGLHASVACVACHLPDRPTPSRECVSCHADWHRGRLSSSCDNCHSAVGFRFVKPLEIHRFTRFPLTGMHALADCNECHRRAADHQWTGAPVDCFGCHEKDYLRPDLRPPHQGPAATTPFSRDCGTCHRPIAWAPAFVHVTPTGVAGSGLTTASPAPPRDHDLRFAISFGPHRAAACSDCHASPSSPAAVRCVGCHGPAQIAAQHKTPVPTLGSSCLSCHPGGARR